MKVVNNYAIKVIATGFIVLVIVSVLLFWARKICQVGFYEKMVARKMVRIDIQPSGLLPELDDGPEVVVKSSIEAYIGGGVVDHSMGLLRNFTDLENGRGYEFCIIDRTPKKGACNLVLFDKDSRLFVFYDVIRSEKSWDRTAKLYAGPKGISETADNDLGRFCEPSDNLWSGHADSFMIFDKSLSCIYRINFTERTIAKSLQQSEIVQVGGFYGLDKNGDSLGPLSLRPPLREKTPLDKGKNLRSWRTIQDKDGNRIKLVSVIGDRWRTYSKEYTLILESDGAIRRLNNKTLEISGPIGFLPSAIDSGGPAKPRELFAYSVRPIVVNDEYLGTVAASLSREAMEIQVAVFDKDGAFFSKDGKRINWHGNRVDFDFAGGPLLLTINYLLENLQPSFFGLFSYCTGSAFEAVDGHNGLFILPNSHASRINRNEEGIFGPFFLAMIIISPSIILGVLLGLAVYKDATVTGFSKEDRRSWLLGTILFGLSAYITYRLTKPKETLVTCQNCGKMRRPDMDRCHRCGGKWQIPELTPPSWRVITAPNKEADDISKR
ncbi:MAG TPA: hypothetical protein ENH94_08950 [Phycisphaerales bacterium]|nr:hypothetical protein [Phycisphaerales bacterium]